MEVLSFLLFVTKTTWWFLTPLFLFFPVKESWLYWKRKVYYDALEFVLLEIRIPPDVLKTPKAMEYVLVGLHGVWDDLNFRDIWVKGERLPSFSLEIAGTGGEVHFYIHTRKKLRDFVESQIYSQYPDAEIVEADDYTNLVPPNLPNKNWDVWGTDLMLVKPDPYPLRTYVDFEEMVEERRLDPIASIAEILNKLVAGEHMWIQIIIQPNGNLNKLHEQGEKVLTGLLGRKEDKKAGFGDVTLASLGESAMMLAGQAPEEEKKEDVLGPAEWRLSPGEREILEQIEEKTAKIAYDTLARFIYIGRNDVFSKTNVAALFGFFKLFNTFNLNAFKPNSKTLPKRSFIYFRKIRLHFRKMRIVQWYKWRRALPGRITPSYQLNVEELATIFHLPGLIVKAPLMPRVETRRPPPPPGLPV